MPDPARTDDGAAPLLARRRRRPVNARTAEAAAWTDWIGIAGFALLLGLTILGPIMQSGDYGDAGPARTAGYTLVFLLAVIGLEPWRRPERLLVVPWPLLLALGWCWLSLGWALEPAIGLRRLVLTSFVLWSIFALARKLGVDRTVLIVRAALGIALAVNLWLVFTDPSIGVHNPGTVDYSGDFAGDWRGIMFQKNYAGLTSALAIIVFVFDRTKIHLALSALVVAAAAVFLYMSDSETSQKMCIASLIFGGLLELLARRKGQAPLAPPAAAWVLLVIPALLFVSMAIDNKPYLEMLSDPGGFTGRTQIWTALIKFYADYPMFGAGYGSFWDLGPTGPIFQYAHDWVTEVNQAHNGYLGLLITIGLPGTLIVLFATLVWPVQRLLRGGDAPVRPLAAAILLFCLGHNLTEAMLFDRDALSQVFLMIALSLLWMATASAVSDQRPIRDAASAPVASRRPSRRAER